MHALSPSRDTTDGNASAICLRKGHRNVPSLSKLIQSQYERTINISVPVSSFHVFAPPLLTGLWGEITSPKNKKRGRPKEMERHTLIFKKQWKVINCWFSVKEKWDYLLTRHSSVICCFFIFYDAFSDPAFPVFSFCGYKSFRWCVFKVCRGLPQITFLIFFKLQVEQS